MKKTPLRIAARRSILIQNLLMTLPLIWLPKLLTYSGIDIPQWSFLIFLVVILPIMLVLLTFYRLRKRHDGIVLQKWRTKITERISARKSKIRDLEAEIKQDHYPILSIIPEPEKMCAFKISFDGTVRKTVMPLIVLDGTKLAVEKIGDSMVICYAGKAIDADKENLTFRSGKFECTIGNPYHISGKIPTEEIVWQCEGHAPERNIFINGNYFPHKNPSVMYSFHLMINGAVFGTYSGSYVPETNAIIVNISGVSKQQCANKECFLKPVFDIRKKIFLPEPIVVSVNGRVERQLSFS